jgi:hypothetical protein
MRKSLALLFPTALLGCASIACCGKSNAATGTATGNVGGQTLNVASALAFSYPYQGAAEDGGVVTGTSLEVALASRPGVTCGMSERYANNTVLLLEIRNFDGIIAPGTYPLNDTSPAQAFLDTLGPSCGNTELASATGGSITLTVVSSATFSGSFALSFGDAGAMTGSFANVEECTPPEAGAVAASCTP